MIPRRVLPAALGGTLLLGGCNWIGLAYNSVTYRTAARGEAANLVAVDTLLYVSLGEAGLGILDGRNGRRVATLPPATGSESVDDLARAGELLFVLDARAPGHVSVYSLADRLHPRLVTPPRAVPVGPFSGVSAGGGLAIVSGGTSSLTAWRYDAAGALLSDGPAATADLGRGQPDVLVSARGDLAFVSTHYRGPYFGLDIVRYDPSGLITLAELPLEGAGFTTGGAKPASFPIDAAPAPATADTLVLAYGRGVALLDVARPERPAVLALVALGGPAVSIDTRDSTILVAVAGAQPALVVLRLAGGRLVVNRRIPLPPGTFPAGVALSATHAAVAAMERGVLVFNR